MNIGVLVSGGGTNLQAILDAKDAGEIPNGTIVTVVSSKEGAFALERASKHQIDTTVISPKSFETPQAFDDALALYMKSKKVELVVMAGFLSILGPSFIKEFENAILNVHPSLIPSFCGKGFYGLRVHKSVLEYGVKLTGATVHLVNEVTDGGPILLQKSVAVLEDDTPESLQKRVMQEAEWEILPQAIALFSEHKIKIEGRKAIILS